MLFNFNHYASTTFKYTEECKKVVIEGDEKEEFFFV